MIRIDLNRQRLNHRVENFKEKLYPALKQQLKKGADKYTPYLSGDLMDSADPSAHDNTPYLIYDIVYAQYQFYADGGAPNKDFPNRTRTVHPLASMMWTDKYLKSDGRRDLQYICNNAAELLHF